MSPTHLALRASVGPRHARQRRGLPASIPWSYEAVHMCQGSGRSVRGHGPTLACLRWRPLIGRVSHLRKPTGCDLHDPTQHLHWPSMPPIFDESEPRHFWLAMHWVAFFNFSLSSPSTRFSWRRRSFSLTKSTCGAVEISAGRNSNTYLPKVELPTPKSDAIRRRGNALGSAIPTASCLESPVRLIAIVCLLE